jgi:hypothetical protein
LFEGIVATPFVLAFNTGKALLYDGPNLVKKSLEDSDFLNSEEGVQEAVGVGMGYSGSTLLAQGLKGGLKVKPGVVSSGGASDGEMIAALEARINQLTRRIEVHQGSYKDVLPLVDQLSEARMNLQSLKVQANEKLGLRPKQEEPSPVEQAKHPGGRKLNPKTRELIDFINTPEGSVMSDWALGKKFGLVAHQVAALRNRHKSKIMKSDEGIPKTDKIDGPRVDSDTNILGYEIIDNQTGKVLSTRMVQPNDKHWRSAMKRAKNAAEKKNMQYGAHRYTTRAIYADAEPKIMKSDEGIEGPDKLEGPSTGSIDRQRAEDKKVTELLAKDPSLTAKQLTERIYGLDDKSVVDRIRKSMQRVAKSPDAINQSPPIGATDLFEMPVRRPDDLSIVRMKKNAANENKTALQQDIDEDPILGIINDPESRATFERIAAEDNANLQPIVDAWLKVLYKDGDKFFKNRMQKDQLTNRDIFSVIELVEDGDYRTMNQWREMFSKSTGKKEQAMYQFINDMLESTKKFQESQKLELDVAKMSDDEARELYAGLIDDEASGAKLTPSAKRLLAELKTRFGEWDE